MVKYCIDLKNNIYLQHIFNFIFFYKNLDLSLNIPNSLFIFNLQLLKLKILKYDLIFKLKINIMLFILNLTVNLLFRYIKIKFTKMLSYIIYISPEIYLNKENTYMEIISFSEKPILIISFILIKIKKQNKYTKGGFTYIK